MKGLDYSWARPGGKAIAEAGYQFVMRYVPYVGHGGKALTDKELNDLHTHGLGVGLVFESTAERHKEGRTAGIIDAQRSLDSAKGLGFPNDTPIYFAVDFDSSEGDQQAIDEYQRGAISILGIDRVGVYGSYYVVERCKAANTAKWFWQTYAWSGGQRSEHNHLYQFLNGQTLNGGEVDFNEAYGDTQGLWWPEATSATHPSSGGGAAINANDKAILDEASRSAEQASQQLFGTGDPTQIAYVSFADGRMATTKFIVEEIENLKKQGNPGGIQLGEGKWEVTVRKLPDD